MSKINKNRIFRTAAAWVVCFGLLAGLWTIRASAASIITNFDNVQAQNSSGNPITYIGPQSTVTIIFHYVENDTSFATVIANLKANLNKKYTAATSGTSDYRMASNSSNQQIWLKASSPELSIKAIGNATSGGVVIELTLKNVKYVRNDQLNDFIIENANFNIEGAAYQVEFDGTLPASLFQRSSGGSSGDSGSEYVSDIVIENVQCLDSEGNRIDHITKDSLPFTLEILYTDLGFEGVDAEDFSERDLSVFLTDSGGFSFANGTKGALTTSRVVTTDGFPRFKVQFRNVRYNEGSRSISFRVQYYLDAFITGSASATVHQADTAKEEDEISPATPYIIASSFNYGDQQIEAGSKFALQMSFGNTSVEIPLENIVMTVSTSEELSIASASNTYYFPSLGSGGKFSQPVELQAKPGAKVGSHNVTVSFTYQYITDNKRTDGKTDVTFAIPVTQIDRFSVDPISDYSSFIQLGDEGYLSVSFVNRGKSTTYNISGVVRDSQGNVGQSQHFGNLEAGKSDMLEFTLIPYEVGEMHGEIVITYEDENNNQKEVILPFSATVEEPWYPPMMPPNGGEMIPDQSTDTPLINLILCGTGALMIAIPVTLYVVKRIKAKGSEDLDEDL